MSEFDSADHAATIREVEESQQELSEALGDLEGIVRGSVDPASWITERPLPWFGSCGEKPVIRSTFSPVRSRRGMWLFP